MKEPNTGVKKRDTWGSQFGLVMAMAGMAIGLGNVWRFPYMVGEYGGGAFVVAYLICTVLVVFPLALVEVGMGKGIGKGLIDCYEAAFKNRKAGILVGGGSALVYATMNFFYMSVLAVCIKFIAGSVTGIWHKMPPEQVYDYYHDSRFSMAILTAILIIAVSFVIYKGIGDGIEKVSKFMVPLIFVFFIAVIVISAVIVPNIGTGFDYFLNPQWDNLKNFDIWVAAMGQACFSVGVGPGCLLIYGSHMKKKGDVSLTVGTIAALDTCVGLLAGMTIIPVCIALGLNPESGEKLIFVVLPAVFARIPGGTFIGILVFLAIFFAGFTSAIAQLEVAITTFEDAFHISRKKLVAIATVVTLIFGLWAVYRDEMFQFWSDLAGNYGFIVTAGIGAICYSWIYGVKKIRENYLNPTSEFTLKAWFDPFVRFIAVPVMVLIMANSLFPFL